MISIRILALAAATGTALALPVEAMPQPTLQGKPLESGKLSAPGQLKEKAGGPGQYGYSPKNSTATMQPGQGVNHGKAINGQASGEGPWGGCTANGTASGCVRNFSN